MFTYGNKCRYAKQRDEYIGVLERIARFNISWLMNKLKLPTYKDYCRERLLINRSKNRRPQAIKIKRSNKMTKK